MLDIRANQRLGLERITLPKPFHICEHSMTCKIIWPTLALSFLCSNLALADSAASKPVITLAAAKAAVSAAVQAAPKQQAPTVISVVDDGGHLIYLERADGVASGMVEASISKARTAALYGFPTKAIEQLIVQGHPGFQNLPDALPVEGGIPVMIHGQLAGAVGVAGGMSPDDGAVAQNAAAAIAAGR